MKYIMYEDMTFIILPPTISHTDVKIKDKKVPIVSAGFVDFYEVEGDKGKKITKAKCYGESVLLNIKSKEEDSIIISCALRLK